MFLDHLADQADFDGASALAALASVATSSTAPAPAVTSLATTATVKKEENSVVSQALSLPVSSVPKQETKDLKSELDEVK